MSSERFQRALDAADQFWLATDATDTCTVSNGDGEVLCTGKRRVSGLGPRWFAPFHLEMTGLDERPVVEFRRSLPFVFPRLAIVDPQGRPLGNVRGRLDLGLYRYAVRDTTGVTVAELLAVRSRNPASFALVDGRPALPWLQRREVANFGAGAREIYRSVGDAMAGRPEFTTLGGFYRSPPRHVRTAVGCGGSIPPSWRAERKLLLLGALVLLATAYFDRPFR